MGRYRCSQIPPRGRLVSRRDQQLATGTWTHDYPISAEEAREMGLPVRTDMPEEILELMSLYPQPVRRLGGGVEYLPEPRHREARRATTSR